MLAAASMAPAKKGLKPGPPHEGNGEGPGGHHVRHGASGKGPHESAGQSRGLGRPTPGPPRRPVRQPDEEGPAPGHVQEGAEENEEVDEVGRDPQGHAPDPLGGKVEVLHEAGEAISSMGQESWEVGTRHSIDQSQNGHHHQPPTRRPSCQLQNHQKSEEAAQEIHPCRIPSPTNQRFVFRDQVKRACQHGHDEGGREEDLPPFLRGAGGRKGPPSFSSGSTPSSDAPLIAPTPRNPRVAMNAK